MKYEQEIGSEKQNCLLPVLENGLLILLRLQLR